MKIKFLMALVALVAITFAGVANATHAPVTIQEGEIRNMRGSFCAEKSDVLFLFDMLESEGMSASIVLYEEYLDAGKCDNTYIGPAKIIRLVAQVGDSIAVEVEIPNGNLLYFILSSGTYIMKGDKV